MYMCMFVCVSRCRETRLLCALLQLLAGLLLGILPCPPVSMQERWDCSHMLLCKAPHASWAARMESSGFSYRTRV